MKEEQFIQFHLDGSDVDDLTTAIKQANARNTPNPQLAKVAKALQGRPERHVVTIQIAKQKV